MMSCVLWSFVVVMLVTAVIIISYFAIQYFCTPSQSQRTEKELSSVSTVQRTVEWVLVGGNYTRVSAMAHELPKSVFSGAKTSELEEEINIILMIPGNPGNEALYDNFEYETSGKHRRHDRFKLDIQIEHKLTFLREYVSRSHQVFIMGHSIGAYMMLKMMSELKSDGFRIEKAIGLFPTIERMADSPTGQKMVPILSFCDRFDFLVKLLLWWIDYLPIAVKEWFCAQNINFPNVPDMVLAASTELLNLNVLRNVVHLANNEMQEVTDLDEALLQFPEKLMFYYGRTDGWCPLSYGEDMKKKLPEAKVLIDDEQCEHAFVIKCNDIIASKVTEMIS